MIEAVKHKVLSGERLTAEDATALFSSDDIFTLGELASFAGREKNGNRAYFVRNLHVNPTNVCVNRCAFCAFSRSKGQEGAFELSTREVIALVRSALKKQNISEVHIVGGLHPEWPFERYLDMIGAIKKSFPSVHIKAFTATEVDHMCKISGLSLNETLIRLKASGLGSMPGGGAEILNSSVRQRLCPEKQSGQRWLEVMEAAHRAGIRSNATMLYGHVESAQDRVEHLLKLRELQDRTGGFQAFIPLSYHPKGTSAGGSRASGLDDLRTIAVSRLMLDNFNHIKAYWVMLGEKISQLALLFGADDLDGTVIEEKITYSAGAESRRGITAGELKRLIKKAGKRPVERDSFYRPVRGAR